MHSRRLEERQLLHRLSKIDDILAVQAAKKKKEEKRNSFQDCMEDTGSAKNKGNRAYDKLDCSRKEAYLLYSYDKSGCHSIIGKDIGPGSYGGRLTSGDFGSKA